MHIFCLTYYLAPIHSSHINLSYARPISLNVGKEIPSIHLLNRDNAVEIANDYSWTGEGSEFESR